MAASGQDEPGSKSRIDPDSPGLLSDCRLMLSFARKNGFVLPPPLVHEIGWLDSVLRALKIPPVSQLSAQLIWPIDVNGKAPRYVVRDPWSSAPHPTAASASPAASPAHAPAPAATDAAGAPPEDTGPDDAPLPAEAADGAHAPVVVNVNVAAPATTAPPADLRAPGLTPEEVVLDVHSKLSLLIAPTTALSLQTSEPPAGKRHIFGGMPPLVQYVIVIAFFSAIGFAFSTAKVASRLQSVSSALATVDAAAAAAAAPDTSPTGSGSDTAAASPASAPASAASPAKKAASRDALTASGATP